MGQMKSMRLVTLFFALLIFVLTGCDKSKENKEFAASYKGTFIRTDNTQLGDPIVSNVTLSFTLNTFNGSSDARNYPTICSGSFTISQSKLRVTNSCYFTADFDWTLVFKGEYNYELNDNHLRIWRTYANGLQDIYDLTKEEE
jgi:hypothetical protein